MVVITLRLTATIVCRKQRQKLKLSVLKGQKWGVGKFCNIGNDGGGLGEGQREGDVNLLKL